MLVTPNQVYHADQERYFNTAKGSIDVLYSRKQFYPWMVFGSSSASYLGDTDTTLVQMIDNEDTFSYEYVTIFLDFVHHPRAHVQNYLVGESISSMTTTVV